MSIRIGPVSGGFVPEAQPIAERGSRVEAVQPVAQAAPAEQEGGKTLVSREDLTALAGRLNEAAAPFNHSLRFEVGEQNRIIIRVVDAATNEVIKEIPPESLIKALKHLEKAVGLLMDEKG